MAQLLVWCSFLLIGFALLLLVEGLIYALAPKLVKRLLQQLTTMSETTLRSGGVVAVGAGICMLFLVKQL